VLSAGKEADSDSGEEMIWPFNRFTRMMLTLQHPRSHQWPTVRKAWLKDYPTCAACGSIKSLQVHHKFPFHLDPAKELDPSNFITLCERIFTDHHFEIGHLGHFKNYNVNVEADADANLAKLNAVKLNTAFSGVIGIGSRKWIVDSAFTVTNEVGKKLTIPKGFTSDGYTGVYECPDVVPAVCHDYCYEGPRTWDDGTPIDKYQADEMLYHLMSVSASWTTRRLALLYFWGVQFFGDKYWNARVTFRAGLRMKART